MIVVALDVAAGRKERRLCATHIKTLHGTILIEEQESSIRRPVRSFKVPGYNIGDATIRRGNRDRLECAVQNRLATGIRQRLKFHIREDSCLHRVFVVGADA